jgi:hypothetical protein
LAVANRNHGTYQAIWVIAGVDWRCAVSEVSEVVEVERKAAVKK